MNTVPPEHEDLVIKTALEILRKRFIRGGAFENPDSVRTWLQLELAQEKDEVFACLFLDNRHRLIEFTRMFVGTIDGATVHPRSVVRKAIELNAAAVVFTHNHPSGVAEPSRTDQTLTRRLQDALALIDCRVLDHIVVSAVESVSFAERGLM